jgi:hypothetical protein
MGEVTMFVVLMVIVLKMPSSIPESRWQYCAGLLTCGSSVPQEMQNERPARQVAISGTGLRTYSGCFPSEPRRLTLQDVTLAVSVERRNQVITALRKNRDRSSLLGSTAMDEVGYTPGYARNVEFGTVRWFFTAIVRGSLVLRGRIGVLYSRDDFLHSQM